MTRNERKRRQKARLEGARQLMALLTAYRERCHWCGELVTPFKRISRHCKPRVTCGGWLVYERQGKTHRVRLATVDHIKPIWRGGTSSEKNIVLACGECNQLRNKLDWIREHQWFDLSQRRRFAEHCLAVQNRMRQKLGLPPGWAPGSDLIVDWKVPESEAMEIWAMCESFK